MSNINQVNDNAEETKKKVDIIDKKPLAWAILFVSTFCTVLITTFVNRLFNSEDSNSANLMEQIVYLRNRVEVLEKRDSVRTEELQRYVRALMFKDAQLKEQKLAIDSLKLDIR